MANRMKELQRMAKSYENRWKSAMQVNNVIESNIATIDYEENIKKQAGMCLG